ncbi:MAG TPA: NAD-dependent epimerase/dehydratase family protein [Acidimicrobiales bacterium]|nr:NAD-dependent epimerase/dehydratase family protein [Acidimicrobiales bacterium]
MTSLVTGATGFLGSRTAAALCERGERVRVLVRTTSNRRRLEGLPVEYAEGDVTDRASVEKALDGVEVVYHSAALYELGTGDPEYMERVNVGGTENVLSAAHERGILAIHVSSVAALGPTGTQPVVEGHWRQDMPRSPYEATKKRAHLLARSMAESGARVRISMPGSIYGPDDPSLLGTAHKFLFRGMPVAVGASLIMSFVNVDDCADGLVRIAERGHDGEEYILVGETATFRKWFETIADVTGKNPPRFYLPDFVVWDVGDVVRRVVPGRPGRILRDAIAMSAGENWSFSGEKARRELGWEPHSLRQGMVELRDWYAEQKKVGV